MYVCAHIHIYGSVDMEESCKIDGPQEHIHAWTCSIQRPDAKVPIFPPRAERPYAGVCMRGWELMIVWNKYNRYVLKLGFLH